jgi:hypothetical protein
MIRIGRDHDGGYVLPRSLVEEADSLLSLGIYNDWSFEAEFQRLKGAPPIDCYDHTIGTKRFKREALIDTLRAAALRTSVSDARARWSIVRSYQDFFRPPVRHFAKKITNRPADDRESDLTSALDKLGGLKVLVKMDIEGSEYRMIEQLLINSDRIIGACVEFHDTEPLRPVFDNSIDKLLGKYAIAHVHANNYGQVADDCLPEILEVTFVNHTLVKEQELRPAIYIPELDQPNDPSRREIAIGF